VAITYSPIATTTLGSAQSSVTFSSISGTYTDLIMVCNIKGTTAIDVKINFNSDTGTNYSNTYLTGNGSAASSGRRSNVAYFQPENNGYVTTTLEQNMIIHFMNYSNTTTYKTALARANNASTGLDAFVNLWRSTSAITSIALAKIAGGDLDTGSTFTLYGIKAFA
jgi:hypothetical protein